MDADACKAMEKQRRADELRAQEVFMDMASDDCRETSDLIFEGLAFFFPIFPSEHALS